MPTLNCWNEIEFEVECDECGASLTASVTPGTYRTNQVVKVEPCEKCVEDAKDEGIDEGKAEGFESGKQAALDVIRKEGGEGS
jgi:hypothetical protein